MKLQLHFSPVLSYLIDFPERHFDRVLVAKTEPWILMGWHHNEMPTTIQSQLIMIF